jgi:hypothetical protein
MRFIQTGSLYEPWYPLCSLSMPHHYSFLA